MSVSVLFALVDIETFKSLSPDEVDQVTEALVAEINSDPALKRRLTDAVSASATEIIAKKAAMPTTGGA